MVFSGDLTRPENMTVKTSAPEANMQIGEVAERTGLTPRTLRYYEEMGLLSPASRLNGGFRQYGQADIERLERIKQMRDLLGISLAQIKEMVEAEEVKDELRKNIKLFENDAAKTEAVERAAGVSRKQLGLVDRKITELTQLRAGIAERLDRYEAALKRLDATA